MWPLCWPLGGDYVLCASCLPSFPPGDPLLRGSRDQNTAGSGETTGRARRRGLAKRSSPARFTSLSLRRGQSHALRGPSVSPCTACCARGVASGCAAAAAAWRSLETERELQPRWAQPSARKARRRGVSQRWACRPASGAWVPAWLPVWRPLEACQP